MLIFLKVDRRTVMGGQKNTVAAEVNVHPESLQSGHPGHIYHCELDLKCKKFAWRKSEEIIS